MLPYVMHSLQELSVISNLNNWANLNVQFIGKLLDCDDCYTCVGVGKNSTSVVLVDFSLAAQIPPRNVLVRIWGEIEMKNINQQNVPVVKAKVSLYFPISCHLLK